MYCLRVGLSAHVEQCRGSQKRISDSNGTGVILELELQMFLATMWVLVIEPGSFARAVGALNH